MRLRKAHNTDGPWAAPQIIALRRKLNITQVELAAKIGTNQVCICRWENGKTRPSRMSMERLSRVGITHVDLRKGDNHLPAEGPVIEPGIPIPAQGTWTEIALQMNYGDSVLLPLAEGRTLMMAIRRTGAHGVQRAFGDNLRVWKVEKPVVHRSVISQAMSQLGKRKKRMSPAAIKARQAAGRASAAARRERKVFLDQEDRAMAPMAPRNGQSREEASGEV